MSPLQHPLLLDPSTYRRRRNRRYHGINAPAHQSPLAAIATTAAVVYGAYRLGSWAWNVYRGNDCDCNTTEEEEENDLLYEWTADHHHPSLSLSSVGTGGGGAGGAGGGDSRRNEDFAQDANTHRRHSRRSREHWSSAAGHNNRDRSHRPSPPTDYYHHSISSDTTGEDDDRHNNNNNNMADDYLDDSVAAVKKTASTLANTKKIMCTAGSAVSAGISAGMHSYEQKIHGNHYSAATEKERTLRMGRCRLEVSRAMMDFLPTLKRAVMKETDVSGETEELKVLRIKRKELLLDEKRNNLIEHAKECGENETTTIRGRERILWNDIKIKSVTRLVTTIYAHTIIFLMLTVQVNLLGGRLLRDEQHAKEDKDTDGESAITANGYHTSHQTVLTKTYHHLFAQGIPILAKSVGGAVREVLQDWDILDADSVTLPDVCSWLNLIRDTIEQKGGNTSSLVKFIIPPEGQLDNEAKITMIENNLDASPPTSKDELATYILNETYDLFESPTFARAEHQCLNCTFDQIQSKVLGKLFLQEEQQQLPLVNIVTHMQKSAVLAFHKPPTYYREEMQSWGDVLGMMEEPLPSVPNDFISRLEKLKSARELSDVCF